MKVRATSTPGLTSLLRTEGGRSSPYRLMEGWSRVGDFYRSWLFCQWPVSARPPCDTLLIAQSNSPRSASFPIPRTTRIPDAFSSPICLFFFHTTKLPGLRCSFLNICKIAIASTGLDRGLSCAPGQQLHGLCTGIYGQTQDEFHSWEIQRRREKKIQCGGPDRLFSSVPSDSQSPRRMGGPDVWK